MCALGLKADMCSALADVCFGPIAGIDDLFDHLVGASDERGRYDQPSAFCIPDLAAFIINELNCFLERNFFTLCNWAVSTMQSIGYQADCLVPTR
jgi:hypothetical protein